MTLHSNHERGMPPAGNGSAGAPSRNAATLGAADWLGLAAAPTFAFMALLTGVLGDGKMAMTCAAQEPSSLGGMIPMYLIMSAFHLPPWLRLRQLQCKRLVLTNR